MRAPPQTGFAADRMLVNLASVTAGGGNRTVGALANNPSMALTVPAGLAANRLFGGYLRSEGTASRLIDAALPDVTAPNPLMSGFRTSGAAAVANEYQNPLLLRR